MNASTAKHQAKLAEWRTRVGECRSSAVIFSLIETAKENHLDPYAYLLHIFRTAPRLDRERTDWVLPLLPENTPDECKVNI